MSAFVVSNKNINRLASVVYNVMNGYEPLVEDIPMPENFVRAFRDCSLQQIAQKLYACNVESVNYRYDERSSKKYLGIVGDPREYVIGDDRQKLFQTIKSIQCWSYQSCEKSTRTWVYVAMELLIEILIEKSGCSEDKHDCRPSIYDNEMYKAAAWCE